MKALNVKDVNVKLSELIDKVTDWDKPVEIARLKQANDYLRSVILNASKELSYNQFMKKNKEIDYFEG